MSTEEVHMNSMQRFRRTRGRFGPGGRFKLIAGSAVIAVSCSMPWCAYAAGVDVINLVTDDKNVNSAPLEDGDLKNPWGVSYPSNGPFWVSDNGTGKSTLYNVDPKSNAVSKAGLVVSIPGTGNVTGQAFNPTAGFSGNTFLFVSEDGTVSGWRGALGSTAEVVQGAAPANIYKGAALATVGSFTYLYAANFGTGNIDVVRGSPGAPALPGRFVDLGIPVDYAPFNVANLNGTVYVSYAQKDPLGGPDEVSGAGHGYVDAFRPDGTLIGRIASQGVLNSPWGMAIAPSSFGALAGDLLVGNFGDGTINVFDPNTKSFVETLTKRDGSLVQIDGLWALVVGNDAVAGSSQKIYFTAGPNDETNGLFGVITVPEPRAFVVLGLGLVALMFAVRRRGMYT
jgi:uncharacterized protein (TIGR03118 family)